MQVTFAKRNFVRMTNMTIEDKIKEQGDLVVQNPDIRNKFEKNLQEKCPYECELKFWKADVISSEVEEKVENVR